MEFYEWRLCYSNPTMPTRSYEFLWLCCVIVIVDNSSPFFRYEIPVAPQLRLYSKTHKQNPQANLLIWAKGLQAFFGRRRKFFISHCERISCHNWIQWSHGNSIFKTHNLTLLDSERFLGVSSSRGRYKSFCGIGPKY